MNLDKLPKLSQTPAPPTPAVVDGLPFAAPHVGNARSGFTADVWIGLVIGLIFLVLGSRFGEWVFSKMTGNAHHTKVNWTAGDKAGQEVAYWDLQGFTALSDLSLLLTGVALIAAALAWWKVGRGKMGQITFAIATLLLIVAGLINMLVVVKLGMGAIISLLGIAILGYELIMLAQVARAKRA